MAPKKGKAAKKGKGGKKGKGKGKGKGKKKLEKKPKSPVKPINGSALIFKYAFDNEENFLNSLPELEFRRDTYVLFKEPLPPKPEPEPQPAPVKKPKKKKKKGKGKDKKGKKKKKGKLKKDGMIPEDGKGKGKKGKKKKGKGKKGKKKVKIEEDPLAADDPLDGQIQTWLAEMQQQPFSVDINYITVDVHDLELVKDQPLQVQTLPTFLKWGEFYRLLGKDCTDLALFGLFMDQKTGFRTSDNLLLGRMEPPPVLKKKGKPKKKGKGKKGKGKKGKGKKKKK